MFEKIDYLLQYSLGNGIKELIKGYTIIDKQQK